MAQRRNWSEGEVRQALSLYLRLEFGKFHKTNPKVVRLAAEIGRTPSAVALKLSNLAALDDSLPRKGMANASSMDRQVWSEFLRTPDLVLEAYRQQIEPMPVTADIRGFAARHERFMGRQSEQTTSTQSPRIGQAFFRDMVLTSYGETCALTGVDDPRLLTVSHIVGWAQDKDIRLHPSNGICLNALHDRAFDRHLITFDTDYHMVIAQDVPPDTRRQLEKVKTGRLAMPSRFLPDQKFLERHRAQFAARAA